MRLATLRLGSRTRAAIVEGGSTRLLRYGSVGDLLDAGALANPHDADPGPHEPGPPVAGADFAPVVPWPRRTIGVGHNYRAHIRELGLEPPGRPALFAKFPSALLGAHDDLILDPAATGWDWEAELAVVIGRTVRHADRDTARAAIAGYTVANDVTARDWQRHSPQWLAGKAWDASTPVGPVLVTPDELNATDLEVSCHVDGVCKQRATTADLLFDPVALIRYISTVTTLQPGDLILTGTPGGIGAARTPPEALRPGQVVETRISGIGTCRNICRAA